MQDDAPGPSGAHGGAAQSSASGPATGASAPADGKKGECWGVNACKGQGACGGPEGHACAGQNACKGKGWLSLTETDCRSRNGKFKAG
ncbi:MAG: hypothetical protein M0D55_18350 [Elusimicrobiota bacterium]|nr:MAG: hypothetical protein M0D55_18350 [Elusimicrobiota bacterium]